MQLTRDQIHAYFEFRLQRSLPNREKIAVKCPFHDDGTASATVFLSGNGGFNCQSCQAKGNIFQFESRFSKIPIEEAKQKIAEITGANLSHAGSKGPCTGVYDYRLPDGTIAFQKRRYEPIGGKKTFSILRPDGRHGWAIGLDGVPDSHKVLYNLPDVVTSNLVLVCEGEKDCATLDGVTLFPTRPDLRISTTTNFEGAWQPGHSPKWLAQYAPFFAGKAVVIFEDNDESGRTWAQHVAAQAFPFALSVRCVSFPELPEKGDVTDWMQTHAAEELQKRIMLAPAWKPEIEALAPRRVFVSGAEFASYADAQIDWLVQGVIQRGANGFFGADPKSAKSWCALDMLISLAIGHPWLEFAIPNAVRCGYVSREDAPKLTAWRLRRLFASKSTRTPNLLEENLYINSRTQTPEFFLDADDDVAELITDIKRLQLELVVLDVFNVIHGADENDSAEMTKVMARVRKIQAEAGCALGIVHHFSKVSEGPIVKRLRGSGAISGFAEWVIGLSVADEPLHVRRMEFELKADEPPDPIYFTIDSQRLAGVSSIIRVPYEPVEQSRDRRLRKV